MKAGRTRIMSESTNPNQPPFQEPQPSKPVSKPGAGAGASSSTGSSSVPSPSSASAASLPVPPRDTKEALRLVGCFRIEPPETELMSSEFVIHGRQLSAWDTPRSVTLPPTQENVPSETEPGDDVGSVSAEETGVSGTVSGEETVEIRQSVPTSPFVQTARVTVPVSEGERDEPELAGVTEIVLPSDPKIVGQEEQDTEATREICLKQNERLAERKRKRQEELAAEEALRAEEKRQAEERKRQEELAAEEALRAEEKRQAEERKRQEQLAAEEALRAEEKRQAEERKRQEELAAEEALRAEEKRQAEERKRLEQFAEWERLQEKRRQEELQRREQDARLAELARREEEIRKAESAQKHENERLTALAQELAVEEARLEALALSLKSRSEDVQDPGALLVPSQPAEAVEEEPQAFETAEQSIETVETAADASENVMELPEKAEDPETLEESEEDETAQESWLVRYLIQVGETVANWLYAIGDFAYFTSQVFHWLIRLPRRGTLLPCAYEIGIRSLPVIALTGTFIGMVLSVQSYAQLKDYYLETRMGALINLSLVRELGPVLAATMLAGRIGSSMAAELGTMRVTEQIDALGSMGVNPVHYLVVPRFLGCMLLIPILTLFADFMGIVGGAYFSVWIFNIDWHFYLTNSNKIVSEADVFIGVFKSIFFGATIGLIGCHRGFNSRAGAQGVGRAATEAFVLSFVFILLLDVALGTIFEALDEILFTPMPRQL